MKSAEKMRLISQHVERSSQEQAKGSRQMSSSIETISAMAGQVNTTQRAQARTAESLLTSTQKIDEAMRGQQEALAKLGESIAKLKRAG